MKKKTMIGVVIGMAIIVGGFVALPKEVSDQINPFVSKKDVYVQINAKPTPRSPGGADYTLIGFTENGDKQEVKFYASHELRKNAFLKVYTKGSYVKTWEEVKLESLPKKVRDQLIKSAL